MVACAVFHPGQGAQYPGMAIDLYRQSDTVKSLFRLVRDITGIDMYQTLCDATGDQLRETLTTQLAVTLANRSARIVLDEIGFSCNIHAGFSLGELAALAGAQIIDDATLFSLILRRGELMEQAIRILETTLGKTSMMAVLGVSMTQVEQLIEDSAIEQVFVANDNSPTQTVIAGPVDKLNIAADMLRQNGARKVVPLRVSGPFHTPLMRDAVEPFQEYVASFRFNDPKGVCVSSVSGTVIPDGSTARDLCAKQLVSTVRWTSVMKTVLSLRQEHTFSLLLEAGPQRVLGGLWASMGTSIACYPAGTSEAIEQLRNIGESL